MALSYLTKDELEELDQLLQKGMNMPIADVELVTTYYAPRLLVEIKQKRGEGE